MKTKELYYQHSEPAPLTTGQNSRLFEQSLRRIAIPAPTPQTCAISEKTGLINQLKTVAANNDLSQFFEPKQMAQTNALDLLERQKAIKAANKRLPKGKIIGYNDAPPNSANMAGGMIF